MRENKHAEGPRTPGTHRKVLYTLKINIREAEHALWVDYEVRNHQGGPSLTRETGIPCGSIREAIEEAMPRIEEFIEGLEPIDARPED